MHKFWATFTLTYIKKIKAKSFVIFMIIIGALMIGLSNIDKIINMFDDGPDKIGVAKHRMNKSIRFSSNRRIHFIVMLSLLKFL